MDLLLTYISTFIGGCLFGAIIVIVIDFIRYLKWRGNDDTD